MGIFEGAPDTPFFLFICFPWPTGPGPAVAEVSPSPTFVKQKKRNEGFL